MLSRLDTRSKLLLSLAGLFVTSLVVGDLIGVKLFVVGGTTFSAGFIPFPITFLLTDLLNEFYGKKVARTVTWVGFSMAVFTLIILTIAVALPPSPITEAPDWGGVRQPDFEKVFGGSRRILIASMVAYLFAQFTDIWVFNRLKTVTHGRLLWLRATGSTVFSQLIDTAVIQTLAWQDALDLSALGALILSSYLGKVVIALGLTPLVYLGHGVVTRWLGMAPVRLDAAGDIVESPVA
jgi:queuosine precursor transporter